MPAKLKRSQLVATYIAQELKSGPIPSTALHAQVFEKFGIKALYSAREILGTKVSTRVKVNGVTCWKLAPRAKKA